MLRQEAMRLVPLDGDGGGFSSCLGRVQLKMSPTVMALFMQIQEVVVDRSSTDAGDTVTVQFHHLDTNVESSPCVPKLSAVLNRLLGRPCGCDEARGEYEPTNPNYAMFLYREDVDRSVQGAGRCNIPLWSSFVVIGNLMSCLPPSYSRRRCPLGGSNSDFWTAATDVRFGV